MFVYVIGILGLIGVVYVFFIWKKMGVKYFLLVFVFGVFFVVLFLFIGVVKINYYLIVVFYCLYFEVGNEC